MDVEAGAPEAAVPNALQEPSPVAADAPADRAGVILLQMGAWPTTVAIARAIEALSVELDRRGLTLVSRHHAPGGRLAEALDSLSPDLVLTDSPLGAADQRVLADAGIDHLSLGIVDIESPEVTLALWQLGHAQVTELAKLGHRHLVYVEHPDPARLPFAKRRFAGVRAAAQEFAIPALARTTAAEDVEAMAAQLRSWDHRVTGAVCYNDEVADLVLQAARHEAWPVPARLSVVGADNLPVSAAATPAITTVYTDPAVAACQYADTICQRIGVEAPPADDRPLTVVTRRASVTGPRP